MRKTDKDKPCYTYTIENQIDGTIYVGVSTKGEGRWKIHLQVAKGGPDKYPREYSYVHKAINAHGKENFKFQLFEHYPTKREALLVEKFWIAELKKFDIPLYNLTEGGDGICGYEYTEEELQQMSDRMKGKFDGEKNPFYGKTHTDETKQIISETRKKNKDNPNYWGENASQSILTETEVLEIKDLIVNSNMSQTEIADKYGITRGAISSISINKNWSRTSELISIDPNLRNKKINDHWDKISGQMTDFNLTCDYCHKNFTKRQRQFDKKKLPRFCGNKCKWACMADIDAYAVKD